MRVFVTGGAGFLGSHIVDQLLRRGFEVACLVRESSNLRWLLNKPVRLLRGDLFPNHPALLEGLRGADWCLHAAGLVSSHDPKKYFTVNAGGTRHVIEACLKAAPGLKRFVLVSSVAAAGASREGSALDEKDYPSPVEEYGQSKLEAERIALGFANRLPVTILRPPAIYGPRDRMMLPVFRLAARRGLFFYPAGSRRTLSMIHVDDVANACLWAAESEKTKGEIFFVSDGHVYTWGDVAVVLERVLRKKILKIPLFKSLLWPAALAEELRARFFRKTPRLNRNQIRRFFRSWGLKTGKIRSAGFTPSVSLEEGMAKTIAGYRQLGWL